MNPHLYTPPYFYLIHLLEQTKGVQIIKNGLKIEGVWKIYAFRSPIEQSSKKSFQVYVSFCPSVCLTESITQLNCERTLVCLLSKVIKPLPSPLYVLHPKAQNVYLHLLKILLLMDVVILVSQRIKKFFNLHLVHTHILIQIK